MISAMERSVAVASRDVGPATDLALSLEAIERRWGDPLVLAGATLRLEPGTISWLGGRNGAGKTTLLRIASGLVAPHAGSISLFGLDPERNREDFQRHLGYVSAGDRGLYARLTVRHNLDFWGGLAMIPRDRRGELIDNALARFDLLELSSRRVDRLSMGQRQRVRLAMGFLHEPRVVLLDEPDASLDDTTLELLDLALAELAAAGGAALWCSPIGRRLPLRADFRYHLAGGAIEPADVTP
jgi:ABC-2 type transport system ATP-binding protein